MSNRDAALAARSFDVVYYQVVRDSQLPDGRTVTHYPLSPLCATPDAAERRLEEWREEYPDAYIIEGRHFLSPDSPKDMRLREKLLSEMVT